MGLGVFGLQSETSACLVAALKPVSTRLSPEKSEAADLKFADLNPFGGV